MLKALWCIFKTGAVVADFSKFTGLLNNEHPYVFGMLVVNTTCA